MSVYFHAFFRQDTCFLAKLFYILNFDLRYMKLRKFYFFSSLFLGILFFLAGFSILSYMNNSESKESSNNVFDNITNTTNPKKSTINILLLGGDEVNANTDTIIVVNYNIKTAQINLLSIPRDTKVNVTGSYVKINYAYPHGGPSLAKLTVEELLGIDMDYYVYIDTSVFRKIIDKLDGVDYYVPVNMDYDDPIQNLHIHLKKGQQHFDGKKSEQFMRFRQPNQYTDEIKQYYDGSDLKRIEAQQSFIKEVVHQKANVYYFSKIDELVDIIFNNIKTNIDIKDCLKLMANVTALDYSKINMYTLPGEPKLENDIWYFINDPVETEKIVKLHQDEEDTVTKSTEKGKEEN